MKSSAALVRPERAIDEATARQQEDAATAPATTGHHGSSRRQQQPVAIIKIARLWPGAERAAAAAAPRHVSAAVNVVDMRIDSLDSFRSESAPAAGPIAISARPITVAGEERAVAAPSRSFIDRAARAPQDWTWMWRGLRWISVAVLSAGAAVSGALAYQRQQGLPTTGTVTIQTTPAGLAVEINGRPSGVTPLTMTLPVASYSIEVGRGAQRRDLTVNVTAGSSVLQHLELPADPAPGSVTTGALRVQTDPPGQSISIDGAARGVSPLTIDVLASGDHSVSVHGTSGTVRKMVTIKAGETVSLLVSPIAPGVVAPGWLRVQSSARLELREDGKLIGTTETEPLMLAAGEHTIELVNDAIGYRSHRTIDVVSGKTTVVPVEMPFGSLSINALPWADVWIDGERVGETPIANLARRLGSYDVVFRHPEFGEKRETITVTLRQTARIGVDMRGKQP
jgi:hypothetical protein